MVSVTQHIRMLCHTPPTTSNPWVHATCMQSPGMITMVLVFAGAAMLIGYEEQGFLQPLTSQACNSFVDTCIAELLGTDASASAVAAMKSVVEAMQTGQLPAADAHRLVLAWAARYAPGSGPQQQHLWCLCRRNAPVCNGWGVS